jgi:uncharacterized protein (DUF362 family)
MDRRDFLKKGIGAGLLAGASAALPGGYDKLFAAFNKLAPPSYDLVAVKGGEPDVMFNKAISSLGGMKSFVKKGQTVVIKPNIGWDVSPEKAGNTNPLLVAQIIKHCFAAGAKDVYVFDHTCDDWIKSYKNSGIERAVKDAGGKVVSGDSEKYYQEVKIPGGKKLKSAKVHELILSCNVFINVPILKHHSSSKLSIAMKNNMGVVWDRGFWHKNDLHQCIADFSTFRKPDLNVIDAYNIMTKNGPRGVSLDDVKNMKSMIISRDIVAADAAAAKLFGSEPSTINYIKIAGDMKIGKMNLEKLSINRIKI